MSVVQLVLTAVLDSDIYITFRRILLSELDHLGCDRASLCSVGKGEHAPDGELAGGSRSICSEIPATTHLRTVSLEPVYVPTIPRPPVPEDSLPQYARQLQQLLLEMSSDEEDDQQQDVGLQGRVKHKRYNLV